MALQNGDAGGQHVGRHWTPLRLLCGQVAPHLRRGVDEDLGRHAIEEALKALALRPVAQHVDVQVAGGVGVAANDGAGDDNAQDVRIETVEDKLHRLAQSPIVGWVQGWPGVVGEGGVVHGKALW